METPGAFQDTLVRGGSRGGLGGVGSPPPTGTRSHSTIRPPRSLNAVAAVPPTPAPQAPPGRFVSRNVAIV